MPQALEGIRVLDFSHALAGAGSFAVEERPGHVVVSVMESELST